MQVCYLNISDIYYRVVKNRLFRLFPPCSYFPRAGDKNLITVNNNWERVGFTTYANRDTFWKTGEFLALIIAFAFPLGKLSTFFTRVCIMCTQSTERSPILHCRLRSQVRCQRITIHPTALASIRTHHEQQKARQ